MLAVQATFSVQFISNIGVLDITFLKLLRNGEINKLLENTRSNVNFFELNFLDFIIVVLKVVTSNRIQYIH